MRYRDLNPNQRKTLRAIVREGRRVPAGIRTVLMAAAVQTVLVEKNAEHSPGGDRDSGGAYQQRPSQGWGPANETVSRDTRQFYEAAQKAYRKGMSAGELAATVQRPAAQYRGRYGERAKDAAGLLATTPSTNGMSRSSLATPEPQAVTQAPPVEDRAARYDAVKALFAGGGALQFASQINELEQVERRVEPEAPRAERERGRSSTPPQTIRAGGGYEGSQGVAKQLAGLGMMLGLKSTSEKRNNTNPYSGSRSDHDNANKDAYAYDLSSGPQPNESMDESALRIMRQLGDRNYKKGQPINTTQGVRTIKVDGGTFRVQVIYRGTGAAFGGDHRSHLHVGVKRIK